MRAIPLYHKGEAAGETIVDDEDYAFLSQWTWYRHKSGCSSYAVRTEHVVGRSIDTRMHRVILGCGPGERGDHIDGDGLNNRRENLRKATHAQNQQNMRSQTGSSSQYRGVFWNTRAQRWNAKVKHNGRTYDAGLFTSEIEAAKVALAKRLELLPFAIESLVR